MDDRTAPPPGRGTTLYRLYDDAGDLLYVGIAGNPGRRFEQHAKDKPWWSEVASIDLEHHPDRTAAMEAERAAIQAEHPPHNIVHAIRAPDQPAVDELVWICDVCDGEIPDRDGYVQVSYQEMHTYRDAKEAFDERTTRNGMQVISGADWHDLPKPARWTAVHADCDPDPDDACYWYAVERIRTPRDLIAVTAHLMEKRWLGDTTWRSILFGHTNPDGPTMLKAAR